MATNLGRVVTSRMTSQAMYRVVNGQIVRVVLRYTGAPTGAVGAPVANFTATPTSGSVGTAPANGFGSAFGTTFGS